MRISDWSSDVCSSDLTLETPGRTAALITPDRVLARRVAAELARYDGLGIDDSAGRPLAQTPPAIFLRLLAAAVAADFAAVPLQIGRTACRERGGQSG